MSRFTNVSHPKLALDSRYLVVSSPDHVELWEGRCQTCKRCLTITNLYCCHLNKSQQSTLAHKLEVKEGFIIV